MTTEIQKLGQMIKTSCACGPGAPQKVAAGPPAPPMLQGPYWDKIRATQKPRAPAAPMAPGAQTAKLGHMLKEAGFMPMLGKGLSMAGRAAGIVPGVGTAAGAVMGGIGGAISAPPGKRMMGAGLGAATGAMGPIAGTAANMVGSHVLGV